MIQVIDSMPWVRCASGNVFCFCLFLANFSLKPIKVYINPTNPQIVLTRWERLLPSSLNFVSIDFHPLLSIFIHDHPFSLVILIAFFSFFVLCVLSNTYSKWLDERLQNHTGYICLFVFLHHWRLQSKGRRKVALLHLFDFYQYVFLNVSSCCLFDKGRLYSPKLIIFLENFRKFQ